MKILSVITVVIILFVNVSLQAQASTIKHTPKVKHAGKITQPHTIKPEVLTCKTRRSSCFLKRITCPFQCPHVQPKDPKAKACFLDCYSPKCEAVCRGRKPNCSGLGAACYDPRFIGGDGIVFYFHGRRNEHFSLISDQNLQINARFIGLRPEGRKRDFTWIQALGFMFGPHNFTVEAMRVEKWTNAIDHLRFTYDGKVIEVPEGHSSEWIAYDSGLNVERTSITNSVLVIVKDLVEVSVNVVPITEEDNKIHNYQIPSNDSFAHLEVQFRFLELSPKVEGILGRTYRPDFENPAKVGVAMAVVGGEDKYWTNSLLSSDCVVCLFSPSEISQGSSSSVMEYGVLDCAGGLGGNGLVCKK